MIQLNPHTKIIDEEKFVSYHVEVISSYRYWRKRRIAKIYEERLRDYCELKGIPFPEIPKKVVKGKKKTTVAQDPVKPDPEKPETTEKVKTPSEPRPSQGSLF